MNKIELCCTEQEVTLKVAMMCGGCEGAVRRVLTKMEGKLSLRHLDYAWYTLAGTAREGTAFAQYPCLFGICISSFFVRAGVKDVSIDLPSNKVVVKGDVQPQAVFDTVAKTGKKTEFWT